MLFALRQPLSLVGLFAGFVLGIIVAGVVQNRLAGRLGVGTGAERQRRSPSLARHIDPFGAIAAALGGVGWGLPVEAGRWRRGPARRRLLLVLLSAPATHLLLAVLAFIGFAVIARPEFHSAVLLDPRLILHGVLGGSPFLPITLLGVAMVNLTMALLHLIPLPPMALGRIVLLLAPETPAWQRARFQLEENNWGVGILLALSLPLFSNFALSANITSAIAKPVLDLVGQLV